MDQPRKRQQRKACDVCRRRKVRCDIELHMGGPCSVCRKSGIECRSTTQWAKPRRRTAAETPATAATATVAAVTSAVASGSTTATDGHPSDDSPSYLSFPGGGPSSNNKNTGPISSNEGISTLWPTTTIPPDKLATSPSAIKRARNGSTDNGMTPTSKLSATGQEQLARNGLARFFKQGIGASIWRVFDPPDFRIAYVGTSASNLAHLVDLHSSYRRQPLSPTATAGDPDGLGRALHYPYPPIRPSKSWKPSVEDWGFFLAHDLASDVSSFPVTEVRDALVTAYFRNIHPYLPVVSMPEFLAAYRTPGKPPPLLLFQAVLMAGAHACTHPLVARDRHAVKSILFRRAALLYHTRHEMDRSHLMQAALLFTWHVGDGDTVTGGPWYWAGIAVRIGCGMGAHRRNTALPPTETSQYRRCWWLAFICEVLSALETGRPCAFRAEDMDQVLMTQDNLIDTPPSGPDAPEATLSAHPSPASPRTRPASSEAHIDTGSFRAGASVTFLNRMVELCFIGLDILAISAPSQRHIVDVQSIDTRLGLWSLRAGIASSLGDGCSGTNANVNGSVADTGADASSSPAGHPCTADDWMAEQCHLHMHYNLMLLHLHRSYKSMAPMTPTSPSVCSGAARAIIASLEKLAALESGLSRCHFTGVSAVTAAAIQTANEVRDAALARTFLVVITALEQLARLLRLTAQLAKHWPNAQAIYDVFQELHQEYETYVTQDLRGEQAIIPDNQPDWNLLLAGVQMAHLNNPSSEQEWLNILDIPC